MILTDTGPLVAIFDKDDRQNAACLGALVNLPAQPLATTWCCFTEAMYLLGSVGGFGYQEHLWKLRASGRLLILDLSMSEIDRMAVAMRKYQDTPMDMADASLIAVAESRSFRRIFTLDSDFRIFRLSDGTMLEMIPE